MITSIRVVIPCSGSVYQAAAAFAAASFCILNRVTAQVTVLIPDGEELETSLAELASQYGFSVSRFRFVPADNRKRTSQLKCQSFVAALEANTDSTPTLFVDADTCCLKPLSFPSSILQAVGQGAIAMCQDVKQRHAKNPKRPWYLPPEARKTYVNSGVILCSRQALDIFFTCRDLSATEDFLRGPFNDQKVLNYALGRFYGARLVLLGVEFNGMRAFRSKDTVIAHFAGGAGRLAAGARRGNHLACCQRVIRLGTVTGAGSTPPFALPGAVNKLGVSSFPHG